MRQLCAVLALALLAVGLAAVIRAVRPKSDLPVISMNTDAPQQFLAQNTEQIEQIEITDEPELPEDTPQAQQPVSAERSVRVRAIGDVIIDKPLLETAYDKSTDSYDFSPLFSYAQGVMADADWTIINVEASLAKNKKYGYMGYPQFCTPHSILEDLKACGVDMLTMCNNHMLDGYFDGLKLSLDYVDQAGMKHVGAYRSQEEYDTAEVYELGGIRVGMMNYTESLNGMDGASDKDATKYGLRRIKNADYAGDIARLRAAGAEVVVCFMHWGEEYVRDPSAVIRKEAQKLVAAGADLVVGGHPHVVQRAEYVSATDSAGASRTALVLYSMGNYISNHRHANAKYTDNGVIFEFTLREDDAGNIVVADPACIPVYVWEMDTAGGKDYRVLPTGVYLNNPPEGMSAEQYQRMQESWNEITALFGDVVAVKAN